MEVNAMDSPVLVTGATGVVGSATCALLRSNGFEVAALSSKDADLRNFSEVRDIFDQIAPRTIIHLAGRVAGIMGNINSQGSMYFENLLINTNVIEAARLSRVRKIVASGSVSVYPDGLQLPMQERDIWMGVPHKSEAGYGHAKRAMLAQLEAYHDQYGIEYAFAICTNLFGPDDRFNEATGHVVPSLLSKFYRGVTEGGPVTVWGTGTATRDLLYSADCACALMVLLQDGHGTYNVASGSNVSVQELVEEIIEVTGYSGLVEWDTTKPDGQAARAYDITRLASLGWAPQVDLRTALAETYDWYSRHASSARRGAVRV
jgi:GDP-L-fucose synthase